jgi:ribonucleoside-diphosphate reductase alpha chain
MTIRWLNNNSKQFLEKDYLTPGQTVEERLKIIGDTAEAILKRDAKTEEDRNYLDGYSAKLQQYIANGWISLSTPIWTNFGTTRGLPISCFNSHFPDTIEGILSTNSEIGTMTKMGGGTSGYFGDVRGRGSVITNNGASNGTLPFLELTQATTSIISQGSTRRGYFAGYQDIFHPDFEEWLGIRSEGNPIQQVTWGACVPTWWLEEMRAGDASKRKIWAKVIQKRFETGLPYIFFTDNANDSESVPEVYRGKKRIKSSNLCTEVFLPSNVDSSFVCDLSSLVDLYYEEWKDTDCVEVVTFLLDAVMTSFIEQAEGVKFMERTVKFAKEHRALGIGRMGYHSLLQSKMVAFESLHARIINLNIQTIIRDQSQAASRKLATMYGECKETEGTGRRNTTTQAIAPTTSSAFIMQVTQSTEVAQSNYYTKDLAKGKFTVKNPYLEEVLKAKGQNTDEVWNSIMKNQGSVLHLDILSDDEKSVFKTAREVSQEEVIIQAAQRQKFIDQGQSINMFITADTTAKEVNRLILLAHDMGVKSLYYQHNVSAASEFAKKLINCQSCE